MAESLFEEFSKSSLSEASPDYNVQKFLADFDKYSKLSRPEGLAGVEEYSLRDVEIGTVVERGTFASRYKVKVRSKPELKTYEVKRIDSVLQSKPELYRECALNIANETRILSCLDHEHIVTLRGVHAGDMADGLDNKNYFIVLDGVIHTLEHKLDDWLQKDSGKIMFQNKKSVHLVRVKDVVYAVVKAMEYLHSKNIIFRDLRPRTVGFDAGGKVLITNFSRARDMDVVRGIGEQLAYSGHARYTAPEVIMGKWYDQKADVYAFGVLLWEILSLQRPFHTLLHENQVHDHVVQGKRPPLNAVSSKTLRPIVRDCWDEDPESRPTFGTVREWIEHYLDPASAPQPPSTSATLTTGETPPGHRKGAVGRSPLFRRKQQAPNGEGGTTPNPPAEEESPSNRIARFRKARKARQTSR